MSEFLLLCAHNGWLDCEGLLDVDEGGEVAKLLFQQEDRRWEYVQARCVHGYTAGPGPIQMNQNRANSVFWLKVSRP